MKPSPGPDNSSTDDAERDDPKRPPNSETGESSGGGQISEAGGASLNAETTAGGADAVPDTHG